MSGVTKIVNTEDIYSLQNDFYHTLIANRKLSYMIRNIFYYNNCAVDTRLVLKYGVKNVEAGYKKVLGYPIKLRKTNEPIGSCRDSRLNDCYIAEITDSDGKEMRDRMRKDEFFKREMFEFYDVSLAFLPTW